MLRADGAGRLLPRRLRLPLRLLVLVARLLALELGARPVDARAFRLDGHALALDRALHRFQRRERRLVRVKLGGERRLLGFRGAAAALQPRRALRQVALRRLARLALGLEFGAAFRELGFLGAEPRLLLRDDAAAFLEPPLGGELDVRPRRLQRRVALLRAAEIVRALLRLERLALASPSSRLRFFAISASAFSSCCSASFFARCSFFSRCAARFASHLAQLFRSARCLALTSLSPPLSVVSVFISRAHSSGDALMNTLTPCLFSRVSLPSFTNLP